MSSPTAAFDQRAGLADPTSTSLKDVQSAKILIIDDEPVNFKVASKYLKDVGYANIVTTANSTEAVGLILSAAPDLILLDIKMPEVSGLEILEAVRGSKSSALTPVIVLTAATDDEIRMSALSFGATDFLAKPVDPNSLIPRVRNALLVKSYQDHLERHAKSLKKEVDHRTCELALTRLEAIHCLARAAEYRGSDTGQHVLRVGHFVGLLARELGFAERTAMTMEDASMLHDVGKIGIPDAILLKPGRLTDEEMDVMRTHTNLGKRVFDLFPSDLLELSLHRQSRRQRDWIRPRSELLTMAGRIAISHHEKWDGLGYPLALAGVDIPMEGRITAVADVFDALSSARPYKPAFPIQKCVDIMKSERGSHFDPDVLDTFLARLDDIVEIRQVYTDDPARKI